MIHLAEAYRPRIVERESLLEDPELQDEAIKAIRLMIERIIVTPRDGGGVDLRVPRRPGVDSGGLF